MNPHPTAAHGLHGGYPGRSLPAEQLTRIAARRAFVEMKQSFMRATNDIEGPTGTVLRNKVRQASEPTHLWRLRAVVLAALADDHERTHIHRLELHRQLDSLFSDSVGESGSDSGHDSTGGCVGTTRQGDLYPCR